MLVTILANPSCPHCVHATDTLTAWCEEAGVPVAGLDALHHPEEVARYQIEQSPSLLIDAGTGDPPRVYTGFPDHAEFLALTRG